MAAKSYNSTEISRLSQYIMIEHWRHLQIYNLLNESSKPIAFRTTAGKYIQRHFYSTLSIAIHVQNGLEIMTAIKLQPKFCSGVKQNIGRYLQTDGPSSNERSKVC